MNNLHPRSSANPNWRDRALITFGVVLIVASLAALAMDVRHTLALADPDRAGGPVFGSAEEAVVFPFDDRAAPGKGMNAAVVDQARVEAARDAELPSEGVIPTRIVIPAIHLDAKVVEARSRLIKYEGKYYSQWVAPDTYAAGWHTYSARLGIPGNTVLNGHHNEYGEVFRRLVDLEVGDEIIVYAGDQPFRYSVVMKQKLPELGQPAEVRLANAAWIMPTTDERLTLVTCWPYESNTHRLIIVARPINDSDSLADISPK
jgi:LPXTG-site transpeptidase (sortase) family protein